MRCRRQDSRARVSGSGSVIAVLFKRPAALPSNRTAMLYCNHDRSVVPDRRRGRSAVSWPRRCLAAVWLAVLWAL